MRFVETTEGELIPISEVTLVREHNASCVAFFDRDVRRYTTVCPISDFEARFADIIPALPGFEVLSLYEFMVDGCEFSYSRQTVIAWAAVGCRRELIPLVASGDTFWREEAVYAILDPFGRVSERGYWQDEFDSLKDWEKCARARFERKERAWQPEAPSTAAA